MNKGMNLAEFKWIFFWEYLHRLWARTMGFVFLLPLIYFIAKKSIPLKSVPRYLLLLVLGGAQGFMGWIMVKSGLVDQPWVDPTKLTAHLLLAAVLYIFTFRLALANLLGKQQQFHSKVVRGSLMTLLWLVILQIAMGGLMAGWKASIPYPTWPKMNGAWMPDNMFTFVPAWLNIIENKALINFVHRMLGYLIFFYVVSIFLKMSTIPKGPIFHRARWTLMGFVGLQVLLGILTVINSRGSVPVGLGVLHQAGAFLLLLNLVYLHYVYKYR
jgi:cytochrome c oxidase assembly protein subunit 15